MHYLTRVNSSHPLTKLNLVQRRALLSLLLVHLLLGMLRCVLCYWQYCITDSHWGFPGAGLVCLSSLGFLASMTAFFSVIPPESPSWAHVWVSCLTQVSVLPIGVVCSSSWCTYTPWCISAPDRGLWNYVMYCFYSPKCTSPKWGLRKDMQTQEMVLSPEKLRNVQLTWQEGQGGKT